MLLYKYCLLYTSKAENAQSFLQFDRHGDVLDNFFKNFFRQCKEPSRFGFSVSYTHLMAAFTAGTVVWNSPAISVAVIHTSLPVTLTALSSMMIRCV